MTNGEKLIEIFPNIDYRLDAETGIIITKWADNTTKCFKASWWNAEYKEPTTKNNLPHCQHTDEEIAKSFIEDVEAVKELLPTTKNDLGVDCISRKAVLDLPKRIMKNYFGEVVGEVVYVKDIMELSSVTPQQRWIPVTERLPEESHAVLACCSERKNIYCAFYKNKQWWIFGAFMEKVYEEVRAWMPLPQPYKELSVFDKIKAEIENLEPFEIRGEVTPLVNVNRVLEIIDKAESEG